MLRYNITATPRLLAKGITKKRKSLTKYKKKKPLNKSRRK